MRTKTNPRIAAACQMALEPLEGRQLMSSSPVGADGPIFKVPLVIQGTNAADTIVAYEYQQASGPAVVVKMNGVASTYKMSDYAYLEIDALGANDVVDASGLATVGAVIRGGAGNDNLCGGSGDDTIYGGWAGSATDGTSWQETGRDTIQGRQGNDHLYAPAKGSAYIEGGFGNDTLVGGGGNDDLRGGTGNDALYGNAGGDNLDGGDDNDLLHGGDGVDGLNGGAGDDTEYGDNDADLFYANKDRGADNLFGGAGADWVTYLDVGPAASGGGVTVSLDDWANDGHQGEGDNVHSDVENVTGTQFNDVIVGSSYANQLQGYGGDDVIDGKWGDDYLDGGYGNDTLKGGVGNDTLMGQKGDDALYGGSGANVVNGGDGNDLIVTVGGLGDKNTGGAGDDTFWEGKGDASDASPYEVQTGRLHYIDHFNNGASTELLGQDLADPYVQASYKAHYGKSFNDIPLFGAGGPNPDDAIQGQVGDCYFMAGLSSTARANPQMIRQSVVDLGDGTYAVRFVRDGKPRYYRVDAQLPVCDADPSAVTFAQPGRPGKLALWAAVMEKAWAFERYDNDHSYGAINGGLTTAGTPWRLFDALGQQHDTDTVAFHTTTTIAQHMRNYLLAGGAVNASTDPGVLGTAGLPGTHVFSVVQVSADLKRVQIRNPWGKDDAGYEFDDNDGLEWISASKFHDAFFFVSYSFEHDNVPGIQ
ncbi:MAG TPA: C2 family cysteine protease [Humisphaera sp.]